MHLDILTPSCSGYCAACGRVHSLPAGQAPRHCLELMQLLETHKRIDLHVSAAEAEPRFSTDYLFGAARGQMFGCLVCRGPNGAEVVLRAFSGQYDGIWEVPGWVGPLCAVDEFATLNNQPEREIKELGRRIATLPKHTRERQELVRVRRELSRALMREIHGLYTLPNFRGARRPLAEVFLGKGGMPTGTGDCCAPKLLNHAARHGLVPLGLAEFYWGRENRSGRRQHGRFYPSCPDKCAPILGFMLCGLEE